MSAVERVDAAASAPADAVLAALPGAVVAGL